MKLTITSIILVLVLNSCERVSSSQDEIKPNEQVDLNISVTAQAIDTFSFNNKLVSNGVVIAEQRSDLRFKINEQIKKIYVQNGQKVRKGSILALLDNSLLKSQLESAKNVLLEAERNLQNEKISFGVNNIPDEKIKPEILRTLYQNSGYKTARNELETVRVLYEQTVLKAPFSGQIANLSNKEGSFISPVDIFCTLVSYDELNVVFHVFESEFNALKKNQEISISPFFSEEIIIKGKIREINPIVNEQGLIRITAKLALEDAILFDGMNVKVSINQQLSNVLIIPKEALVLRSNREVVFTVKNNKAQWNYVTIVNENDKYYAISEGLKAQDSIIISGNLNLTQDARVIVNHVSKEL